MKNKLTVNLTNFSAMFALVVLLAVSSFAQDNMKKDDSMMKKDDTMMMAKTKPTVVIVRASWCPACRTLEPVMSKLMEDYKGKLEFVVLDVTDDKTKAVAKTTAEKHGLGKFFEEHGGKTSTVAVFDLEGKTLFQIKYNSDKDVYVKAFDEAIAKTKDDMMKKDSMKKDSMR